MRIGIISMPGRHKYRGQCIQTRFFILGLPIFPTSCVYKISDNLGLEVPLTGKDIFHAFAKIHFGLIGVGLFIWGSNMGKYDNANLKWMLLVISAVLIGLSVYSWLMHSEAKDKEEMFMRRVLGQAFLYNMPPEYLPVKVQKSLFAELLKIYLGKFGKLDWQATIKAGDVTKENLPLLFSLAHYQQTLEPSQKNKDQTSYLWDYLNDKRAIKTTNKSADTTASQKVDATAKEDSTPQSDTNSAVNKDAISNLKQNFSATQGEATQEKTPQESTENPKIAHILKLMNEIQDEQKKEKSAPFKDTANPSKKRNVFSTPMKEEAPLGSPIKMSLTDVAKVSEARGTMVKQMLMVFAFFPLAIIVVGLSGIDSGMLAITALICLLIVGAIVGVIFVPDYMKLQKDMDYRKKIRIKVRISDLAEEAGTAYLVLKQNKYGITKLTAPSKYYSTSLLNKELDIYVSKEGHILLDILGSSY